MINPADFVPFADPAFAPDWVAGDRPDWPSGPTGEQADRFRAYCLQQLDELDRRARAMTADPAWVDFRNAMKPALEAIWRDFEKNPPSSLTAIGVDPRDYDKLLRREIERKQRAKEGLPPDRSGPTANAPGTGDMHPSSLAAEDMAKLRFVVFPRFWAGAERNDRTFNVHATADLAASRHEGCEQRAVYSRYNKSGLPKRFEEAAAQLRG